MINKVQESLDKVNSTLKAFALKLTGNNTDANDLYQDTEL